MIRAAISEARVFQSWLDYQDALMRAIAPLTAEQLQRRPLPGRRTLGEVAEHIVFGRALHLGRALGEEATGLTPFPKLDSDSDPPRSASDIVRGLESTWQLIERCVMRGNPTDENPVGDELRV
jgi:DinB superfamily